MRIDSNGKKFYTRYELRVSDFKGRTCAEVHDDYWDSRKTVFYRNGHPEEAIDCSRQKYTNDAFKALRDTIATLTPGWYAIEMPDGEYPFGHTYNLLRIPGRHLRYKTC